MTTMSIGIFIYFLSVFGLLWAVSENKNPTWLGFGFVYFLYSLPFLFGSFEHTYFGRTISGSFSLSTYLLVSILALLLTFFCLIDSSLGKAFKRRGLYWERYGAYISIGFVLLGGAALFDEVLFWGSDLFLTGTAERWGQDVVNMNLWFVSIDYILFLMAGFYGLYEISERKAQKKNAFLYIGLYFLFGVVGLLVGHRYYVALIFLAWVARPGLNQHGRKNRLATAIFLIPPLLVAAANIKSIPSYLYYYDYVNSDGFIAYFMEGFRWFPSEITAISANTFIGFSYADSSPPEFYRYIMSMIPFGESVFSFSFSDFSSYYSSIGHAANLNLSPGQGTGFSFFLESVETYYFIVFLTFFVLLLYRLFPSPVMGIIVLVFCLNVVRNGFYVSLSAVQVPVILLGLLVFVSASLKAAMFSVKSSAISNPGDSMKRLNHSLNRGA